MKLLDGVRREIRFRQYSYATEKSCVSRTNRFILFHGKRIHRIWGAKEIERFLSWLATERRVAAVNQNQALNALVFLYPGIRR
jgi:hypothetical protein